MNLTLSALQQSYRDKVLTPKQVINYILSASGATKDYNAWIYQLSIEELTPYLNALGDSPSPDKPLWGIPFAIKDNIDLANIATTAACPEFSYTAAEHADVVQKLIDAGAIPIGKTNMDQFATGLNGTRSPYGICKNSINPDYISGGSSSGSAIAVALNLVSFSLGTDTAGSGRVPAALNNLIGLKPTKGLLSNKGLVPACLSLDSISIFANTVEDAQMVFSQAQGENTELGYSRENPYHNHSRYFGLSSDTLTFGIIPEEQLKFFGDTAYQQAYQLYLETLKNAGIQLKTIDYQPFDEAALLLYEGPWVTERYIAIEEIIEHHPEAVEPTVRSIIQGGKTPLASDLFKAQYRLEDLKKQCYQQLKDIDCLLTPTIGKAFTIKELVENPISANSDLGYYTNFMNLLDLSAIALPANQADSGMPFGITLASFAYHDQKLLSIAKCLETLEQPSLPFGLDSNNKTIEVAVCGAHLEGMPLNWQLKDRGATLVKQSYTTADHRFYLLNDKPPLLRPALVKQRQGEAGESILVEIWAVPTEYFGSFVAEIPKPLGIGKVSLIDGSEVSGFICDDYGLEGATDITHHKSWHSFIKHRNNAK